MHFSAKQIEPFDCTFLVQIHRENNLQYFVVFSNVLLTLSFTKQGSLQSFESLSTSGAEGFRGLGCLPLSEEPKRKFQGSLAYLPRTEWPKEWVSKK